MDVFELSEKNFGLVLEGRASANMYSPDDFVSPYDDGIRILQKDGACKEDLAKSKVISTKVLQDAHDAVRRLNGLGEFENFDWHEALIKAKHSYDIGKTLKKAGERAERNDEVEWLQLQGLITSVAINDSFGLTQASQVDYSSYKPFKKSGTKVIDDILGGFPSDGPIIVYGLTGVGKCLAKGTKILMFDGSIREVERIKVSDLVMGPDSRPRKVTALGHGFDEMFDVIPVKGEKYTVNSEHILSLRITNGSPMPEYYDGMIVNMSVKEYINMPERFKHIAKGWRTGVDFYPIANPIELDPYFLGAWLGDGDSRRPSITSMDDEVIDFLHEYAGRMKLKVTIYTSRSDTAPNYMLTHGYTGDGTPNPITDKLRKLNVIKNKHIPQVYKSSSRDIRLQVLAGLIDTDGSLMHNCYDYVSKQEQLANDVVFISRSLGLSAYMRPCEKTCVNNGKRGTYYRVTISGDVDMIPVKVEHKKASPRQQKKNVLNTGVMVQSVGQGEYFGFTVDKDGLFLLGDFTVTHNSHMAASTMDNLLHEYPHATGGIYTLEMSAEHYLWRETNMYKSLSEVLDRLYVSGSVKDVEQLVGEVTTKRLDYVVLDDMDNMVKEQSASEYERVYNRIKAICRFLKIPVFVLCQPNRNAKLSGRFLGRYDIAWSGAAENSAALQIALQKANALDMQDDTFSTFDDDKYYMLFWKSRDGWPQQVGPGAIILDESKQMWRGKPVKGLNKLWLPGSSRRNTIGKKKGE